MEIITICKILQSNREYVLSKQLIGSGTSIGANIEEATQAQSTRDFIAKLSIAHKEAFETQYWLRLLRDSGTLSSEVLSKAASLSLEVIALLTAILKKTKQNAS